MAIRESLFTGSGSEMIFVSILVITILIMYQNTLDADFIWDDRAAVVSRCVLICFCIEIV